MRLALSLSTIIAGSVLFSCVAGSAQPDKEPQRKPFGLEKRVPWTGSKVIGSPEPPPPYRTERAFAKLTFNEPLDLTFAPGTNRMFVAERYGKIYSFVNKTDVEKADLAVELKTPTGGRQVIYSITMHPKFKENGHIFVTLIPEPDKENNPKGSRVSRFTVKGEPPTIERASEKIVFEWPSGGHNGGGIRFGPDGFLYIVTGDGSGIADQLDIGQDLSSIFAKLLRIDVDNPGEPGGVSPRSYGIPKDNPFVNTKGARPEIYAYGLRQLWRFSFDLKTGGLWGGEVGQDLWEMVYKIKKGGNYGWSVMEGTHPFRPERKTGPTPILKPVVEHSHTDFRSITGGYVYHGKRLPELQNNYVYGDFDTGRVWTFRPAVALSTSADKSEEKSVALDHREIARTTYRIVSWGEDADGELYFLDFTGGGIHQLTKADKKLARRAELEKSLNAIARELDGIAKAQERVRDSDPNLARFLNHDVDLLLEKRKPIEAELKNVQLAIEEELKRQERIRDLEKKINRLELLPQVENDPRQKLVAELQLDLQAERALLQQEDTSAKFPRKLSETGIFASTKDHKIAPGIIPYSVNGQLWGDHAHKERFIAIPNNGQIGFDEITYPQPSPGAPPGWKFPDGTVLVKTFSMDMERGNPKSRKRLETRLLHFQQFPGTQEYGDQYWRGYTYVWNDEQTDAVLLDEKGADKLLKIKVGDKTVEQNYHFPSRAECTLCHNNAPKFALGVSTMQMNRDHVYPSPDGGPSIVANQLATLDHIGLFSKKLPAAADKLAKLADFNDAKQPVAVRARSYLQSNCAHCHMKWGGGNAEFKLLSTISLDDMGIVNVNPVHGNFNVKGAKLIVPGQPEQSIIYQRMNMTGLGRMPHIGSRVIDDVGVKLVHDWIKAMPVR